MLAKVTGSTDTPIQDGTARGVIFAAISAVLAFAADKTDWLTDSDIVTLGPVVIGLSFFLAGIWDKLVKPRLQ